MRSIWLGVLLAIFIFRLLIGTEAHLVFWLITLVAFALGFLLIVPIGGADIQCVISMLDSDLGMGCGRHQLHALESRP